MSTLLTLKDISSHPNLPSPPGIFLKVLDIVSNPNCSLHEIADLIKYDAGLSCKILKTINSALFGLSREVTTIDRALKLVGLKAVRAMVLGLVLPGMQRKRPVDNQTREYWTNSVAGAVVARELAKRRGRPDSEDFLLAGLLRDLGMLVLDQIFPAEYGATLSKDPIRSALEQNALETRHFGVHHAQVTAHLLRQWRLPEDICLFIEFHHELEPAHAQSAVSKEKAWILYFACRIAQMLQNPNIQVINHEVMHLAKEHLGLDPVQLGEFLAPLENKVRELAKMMEVDISHGQGNYAETLLRAVEVMAELTLENGLEAVHVSAENQVLAQKAEHWQRVAGSAQQGAFRDSLTQLYNRAFFEEALRLAYHQGRRRDQILGLLFLDLDGFKALNDRHGHAFGDEALKEIGVLLQKTFRSTDVAARLGGDEFCVLVHNILPDDLHRLAINLWTEINALTIRRDGKEGKVGVSVGAVVGKPWERGQSAEAFLAAADQAMYAVKKNSKNQVQLVSWLDPKDQQGETAIRRRLFSTYLKNHHQLDQVMPEAGDQPTFRPRRSLGRLARDLGWLKREDLIAVLRNRRQSRRPLVEIAVTGGLLTSDQGLVLLAIQREHPDLVVNALVQSGWVTNQGGRSLVQDYFQTAAASNHDANDQTILLRAWPGSEPLCN